MLGLFFFTKCINNEKDKADSQIITKPASFAGSATCVSCHKAIYDSHINTAHFLTSAVADEKNIRGSFETGKNTFEYFDGSMVAMEKRAKGLYQVAYINNIEKKANGLMWLLDQEQRARHSLPGITITFFNYRSLILQVLHNGATAPVIPIG